MFQTLNHWVGRAYAGHINLSYYPEIGQRIQAWSHGEFLGDHYKTVAGARCAITRAHRRWIVEFNSAGAAYKRECEASLAR